MSNNKKWVLFAAVFFLMLVPLFAIGTAIGAAVFGFNGPLPHLPYIVGLFFATAFLFVVADQLK
jgi:hypothetical protein